MTDEGNMDAMEQGEPVEAQARDRMVHGLLVTRHELPIDRQRRIKGLMQRVQSESLRNAPWRRVVRHLGGLAAVAAVLVAALVISPREVNAADRARVAAQNERAAKDRRMMFLLTPPTGRDADREPLTGTLDVRDASHMVLTLRMHDGKEQIMGRNGDSAWSIGPRGVTRVDRTDRPWPVWIESPRYGLVVDMAEMLETGLLPDWNWKREEAANVEPGVERLVATRTKGRSGEPDRIDVQINTLTGRVKRMEIKWPEGGMPRMPRDGTDMRGDGEGDHRPPPMDGRRPPRGDGDGMGSAEGHRPPPRGDGEGTPPMDGRRPPRNDGEGTQRGAPGRGPDGPGGGPGNVPMGPPGSIVIVPEPPVTFTDDWFTAEHHAPKATTQP